MASVSWLEPLLRLLNALLEIYRSTRRNTRTGTVRADPGTEWLRKFGGKDQRSSSGTGNPGGHGEQ